MSKKAPASARSAKGSKRAQASRRAAPARKATTSRRPATPKRAKTVDRASAAMFEKVAFTMFGVKDAMRARAFYEDVLGLTRGLASPDGMWTEYDLPGGGCLALFFHPNPAFARPPGGASVALEVADLDALNTRLAAAGVVYQGEVIHGPHCRMSNILDSEGNAIILHELAGKR
jgi:catechol 2,3-dioxygenase-like lactoylglutathione lyase family enzyme